MESRMATLKITNGPSKLDLMLALFDRPQQGTSSRKATFVTEDGKHHIVTILSVEAEDGSRESWNIKAHIAEKNLSIYYRTDNREGFVL